MSLSAALNTAKSSLAASQVQTGIVSSNIANVNTPGATRKVASLVSGANGTVHVSSVAQSSNSILFRNMLDATSQLSRFNAQGDVLSRLNEIVGDTTDKQSPQARISALNDALSDLANTPGNYDLARAAVQAAQDLASTLRDNADAVNTIRRDADTQLSTAATDMNRILAELETVNRQVVAGTTKGSDVTDLSDQRDRLVKELSNYVGLSVQTRGNNDMVVYTDSGVTLLETQARNVSFTATNPLVAGQPGNAFYIDGVAVTGNNSYMPIRSGLVVGLTDVRDDIAVTYGKQIDEMARGLVSAFAEYDQTGSGAAKTGLFTTTMPMSVATDAVAMDAYAADAPANGDELSFSVTYQGTKYTAKGKVTIPATAAEFAAQVQTLAAKATAADGSVLGAGHVAVSDNAGSLSFQATGVGTAIGFQIGDVKNLTNAAGGVGGLKAVASVNENAIDTAGLAASLTLAAGLTSDPTKVRDGVNYDYNASDLGGFSGRINALTAALGTARGFSADAGAVTKATLADFASSSISWLQDSRSTVTKTVSSKETLVAKTTETLSNETGINLDEELTRLLELERSYQASAKIISTVDQMMAALLQSI
ncbi:flagellar hook-associated protein FlgK [Aureimonas sp. ME7]|uniref:flagellar hook-associated protein FlgK n=1 Tax=Aureimonas sp. ME7 TaxID=2744252 RepID=UPI0015F51660|nr:flagellar hook-associated protein FlgK [Aureimonas sp. ME7]